uniref:hypothetical protein n=1 Tax=Aeromonas sp. Ne-1 TaxID=1675689 RepID=UPI00191D8BD8
SEKIDEKLSNIKTKLIENKENNLGKKQSPEKIDKQIEKIDGLKKELNERTDERKARFIEKLSSEFKEVGNSVGDVVKSHENSGNFKGQDHQFNVDTVKVEWKEDKYKSASELQEKVKKEEKNNGKEHGSEVKFSDKNSKLNPDNTKKWQLEVKDYKKDSENKNENVSQTKKLQVLKESGVNINRLHSRKSVDVAYEKLIEEKDINKSIDGKKINEKEMKEKEFKLEKKEMELSR